MNADLKINLKGNKNEVFFLMLIFLDTFGQVLKWKNSCQKSLKTFFIFALFEK